MSIHIRISRRSMKQSLEIEIEENEQSSDSYDTHTSASSDAMIVHKEIKEDAGHYQYNKIITINKTK